MEPLTWHGRTQGFLGARYCRRFAVQGQGHEQNTGYGENRIVDVFMITPYRFDQQFPEKRSIVERIAATCQITMHYATFHIPLLFGGFDLAKTIQSIRAADFIIADLTYERPSCYYELGYAHGIGKAVHLIAYDNIRSEHIQLCEVLGLQSTQYYSNLHDYEVLVSSLLHSPPRRRVQKDHAEPRASRTIRSTVANRRPVQARARRIANSEAFKE